MPFYKDSEHKKVLINLLNNLGRVYSQYDNEVDQYYLSALYILAADDELRHKCLSYIGDEGIDFPKMLKSRDFGSGHKLLVKLAQHLFTDRGNVSLVDMINILDDKNYKVAMQAIAFRRQGAYLNDL